MSEKTAWEQCFDARVPIYEERVFTKNTLKEADFLIDEMTLPPGSSSWMSGSGRDAVPSGCPSAAMP